MIITFLNENSEKNLTETGVAHWEGRKEDFAIFMENDEGNEETGPFYDYGLCFDKVEPEEYYRYQLSWGGPSDEIRFHQDGTVEYVYLDWFCGVGFNITNTETARFLQDWFEGCEMINWEEV